MVRIFSFSIQMNVTSDHFSKELNHIACEIDEVKPPWLIHFFLCYFAHGACRHVLI